MLSNSTTQEPSELAQLDSKLMQGHNSLAILERNAASVRFHIFPVNQQPVIVNQTEHNQIKILRENARIGKCHETSKQHRRLKNKKNHITITQRHHLPTLRRWIRRKTKSETYSTNPTRGTQTKYNKRMRADETQVLKEQFNRTQILIHEENGKTTINEILFLHTIIHYIINSKSL